LCFLVHLRKAFSEDSGQVAVYRITSRYSFWSSWLCSFFQLFNWRTPTGI